jgi:hypothetical protein
VLGGSPVFVGVFPYLVKVEGVKDFNVAVESRCDQTDVLRVSYLGDCLDNAFGG